MTEKPYYDDGLCVIYHGDCMDVLPSLDNIALVLTSPPFNLRCPDGVTESFGHGGQRNANSGDIGTEFSNLSEGYGEHDDNLPHAEYVEWQRNVLSALWDTLAAHGAIYYQHKPIVRGNNVRLPMELNPGLPLRQVITWDRGSGFMRVPTFYVPRYEWLLLFAKPAFRIVTRNVDDLWQIPFETGNEHPAPFPLALASRVVNTTAGGGTVLDPFMGSGTTLRAAKDVGRKAIGIEKSERFCEIAAKRLGQEVLAL